MNEPTEDDRESIALRGDFISRLSTYAANALRYWEPRRLIYNAVLGSSWWRTFL
jgi:hypothetical protein